MTNQELANSRLADARHFLEHADRALQQGLYHHVVQFAQRAAELALKALLVHLGKDVPHVHHLAKLVSSLPSVRALPAETQGRLYESGRSLEDQRIVSTYGAEDGTPPEAIFDQAKAAEALEQGRLVVETVATLIGP